MYVHRALLTLLTDMAVGGLMKKLEGKLAVITGGSSGIGLASAGAFIAEGAQVVIVGRDENSLDTAKRELGDSAITFQADVSDLSSLDRLFASVKKQFGRIDVLFANAGAARFLPIQEVSEEIFDQIVNVNLKGTFFTVQKALPLMGRGGSIILTSSGVHSRSSPGGSIYAASKAAVRSLGRGFGAELAEKGIRVNVLTPGPVETPIFERMGIPKDQVKHVYERLSNLTPIRRMAQPREMASVAVFLASEDSSFLIGSEVAADGGAAQL
jgi:NAD(P)-dependent dehydrogenase (short-subunit alcohol dehydrogenase family)